MVLMHSNIGRRNLEWPSDLSRRSADCLCREMGQYILIVFPLHHRAMRFEATMGDHRDSVRTLHGDLSFTETFLGIAAGVLIGNASPLFRNFGVDVDHQVRQYLVLNFYRA